MEEHYKEMEDLDKEEYALSMSHDTETFANEEFLTSHDPESITSDYKKEAAKGEWKAVHLVTEWGTTDDIVTLGNGTTCYFFKVPHKVGQMQLSCMYQICFLPTTKNNKCCCSCCLCSK